MLKSFFIVIHEFIFMKELFQVKLVLLMYLRKSFQQMDDRCHMFWEV